MEQPPSDCQPPDSEPSLLTPSDQSLQDEPEQAASAPAPMSQSSTSSPTDSAGRSPAAESLTSNDAAESPTSNEATTKRPISDESAAAQCPQSDVSYPSMTPTKSLGRTVARGILWSAIFSATISVSAAVGTVLALVSPLPDTLAPQTKAPQLSLRELWDSGFRYRMGRPVNILVMGIDRVPDTTPDSPEFLSGRTDTMLLVRVNPEDQSTAILSIPRDTQVELTGLGTLKINEANVIGGSSLSARVVSQTLGDVPIDRYVRVSTDAFREIIDIVGGVEVFVPQRMSYVDETQGLEIDLEPGQQVLNGDQAEQFARFRNDAYGDIGRVQRQQILLQALQQRLINPAIIPRLPQIVELLKQYIDTNLTAEEILALASFGLKLDRDNLSMVMLPGRFSGPNEYIASYWIMDLEQRDRVVQQYFNPNQNAVLPVSQTALNQLRIAIQSASDDTEISWEVARYLRDQGLRNVYVIPAAPEVLTETEVIAQTGDTDAAKAVGSLLRTGRTVAASTGDLESDLTVRVGTDWSLPKPSDSFAHQ